MLKKVLSVLLIALFTNVAANAVYASSQDDQQARRIEKVKEGVRKLGTGVQAPDMTAPN